MLRATLLLCAAAAAAASSPREWKFVAGDHVVRLFPTGNLFGASNTCTYSYLVGNLRTGEAAVVDPGGNTAAVLRYAEQHGLNATAALLTHAHVDHIQGLPALAAAAPWLRVHLHPADAALYEQQRGIPLGAGGGVAHAGAFAAVTRSLAPLPPVTDWLRDGGVVSVGGAELRVLHTPGHSPGHVCLLAPSLGLAFGGDLVLGAGVGRTDFAGGDESALRRSLVALAAALDGRRQTMLLSGHAAPLSWRQLLQSNAWAAAAADDVALGVTATPAEAEGAPADAATPRTGEMEAEL